VPMAKRRPAIWRPAAHGYGVVGRGGARGGGTPVLGHGGGELTGARLPAVASVDWCDSPVKGQMGGRDEGLRDCRRCRRSGGAQGRVDGAGERLERATAGDTFVAALERWHCEGGPLARQLENEHGPTDQRGGVGDFRKLRTRRLSPVAAAAQRRLEAVMEREEARERAARIRTGLCLRLGPHRREDKGAVGARGRGRKRWAVAKQQRPRFGGDRWGGAVRTEAALSKWAPSAVAVRNRPSVALGRAQILCTTFFFKYAKTAHTL
jgi:hypothetical protein